MMPAQGPAEWGGQAQPPAAEDELAAGAAARRLRRHVGPSRDEELQEAVEVEGGGAVVEEQGDEPEAPSSKGKKRPADAKAGAGAKGPAKKKASLCLRSLEGELQQCQAELGLSLEPTLPLPAAFWTMPLKGNYVAFKWPHEWEMAYVVEELPLDYDFYKRNPRAVREPPPQCLFRNLELKFRSDPKTWRRPLRLRADLALAASRAMDADDEAPVGSFVYLGAGSGGGGARVKVEGEAAKPAEAKAKAVRPGAKGAQGAKGGSGGAAAKGGARSSSTTLQRGKRR
jgi:hypothetical protein